ncbi:hypothetical protein ACFS3C_05480 [Azotobacter vinelandii]
MFEVFKYFGGHTSPANAYDDTAGSPVGPTHFGPWRYSGDDVFDRRDAAAFSDSRQTLYKPVVPATETCKSKKNYLILIGNGWSPNGEDEVATLLKNVGEMPVSSIKPPRPRCVMATRWPAFYIRPTSARRPASRTCLPTPSTSTTGKPARITAGC